MDQLQIDNFIMTNQKYFPDEKIVFIKEKLKGIDEEKFNLISSMTFKNPTSLLMVSFFLGSFGIDRFMLGDIGMGILKLLTCGCSGVFTIVDWFLIGKMTKELNFKNLMIVL